MAEFLSEGLHTRRGLTAEEYTAVCRRAWDACQTSSGFPFKILIDPLHSIESMLANSSQEYIHYRVADELEAQKDPSMEIRCVALGAVKPDLSTGPDDGPPLPTEEPEAPETRRYLLAVFDVLGFSSLLQEKGLSEITALYARLIAEAVTKEAMRTTRSFASVKPKVGLSLAFCPSATPTSATRFFCGYLWSSTSSHLSWRAAPTWSVRRSGWDCLCAALSRPAQR